MPHIALTWGGAGEDEDTGVQPDTDARVHSNYREFIYSVETFSESLRDARQVRYARKGSLTCASENVAIFRCQFFLDYTNRAPCVQVKNADSVNVYAVFWNSNTMPNTRRPSVKFGVDDGRTRRAGTLEMLVAAGRRGRVHRVPCAS
jgi:hypothetical protein